MFQSTDLWHLLFLLLGKTKIFDIKLKYKFFYVGSIRRFLNCHWRFIGQEIEPKNSRKPVSSQRVSHHEWWPLDSQLKSPYTYCPGRVSTLRLVVVTEVLFCVHVGRFVLYHPDSWVGWKVEVTALGVEWDDVGKKPCGRGVGSGDLKKGNWDIRCGR